MPEYKKTFDHPDFVRETAEYVERKGKGDMKLVSSRVFFKQREGSMFRHGFPVEFQMFKECNGYVTDAMFPYSMVGQVTEWCIDEQTAEFITGLVRMLRPKILLETGTNRGRSTRAILDGLFETTESRLWTVDMQDYGLKTEGALLDWQIPMVTQVIARLPGAFSEKPLSELKGIDFAFVDAGHTAEELEADLEYIDQHRAEDCWVVVHDTRSTFWDEIPVFMRSYNKHPVISLRSMNGTDLIWMRDVKDHPI